MSVPVRKIIFKNGVHCEWKEVNSAVWHRAAEGEGEGVEEIKVADGEHLFHCVPKDDSPCEKKGEECKTKIKTEKETITYECACFHKDEKTGGSQYVLLSKYKDCKCEGDKLEWKCEGICNEVKGQECIFKSVVYEVNVKGPDGKWGGTVLLQKFTCECEDIH